MIFFINLIKTMINEFLLNNKHPLLISCTELLNNINKQLNIDENEHIQLDIVDKKSYSLFCCRKEEYQDNKYNNKIFELKQLLKENNIDFDTNEKVSIEFNYGYSNEKKMNTGFSIHNDIGSKIEGPSYTIIVYINTNCKNGELIFYQNTTCNYEPYRILNPNSKSSLYTKVVIFDGSLYHCPEPYYGKRCAFVFQIKK